MTFIAGVDRSQALLLPESFEDYIAKDHPVRFIDAFVDGLRLERIDARLSEFLSVLDESDAGEQASGQYAKSGLEQKIEALHARQKELQATLEELEKSGQNEVSLTDADSRRMHREGVGYNAQ